MSWIQTSEQPPTELDAVSGQVWAMWQNNIAYLACWREVNAHNCRAWCKIAQPPEYVEPVKYREPTIRDLLGGVIDCEVADSNSVDKWKPATLRAIDVSAVGDDPRYYVKTRDGSFWWPKCRIKDTLVSSQVS